MRQVIGRTLREHPRLLVVPLTVLVLCLVLGIFGVLRAAADVRLGDRSAAQKLALSKAQAIENSLKARQFNRVATQLPCSVSHTVLFQVHV